MKAELLELKGKYYATRVKITNDKGISRVIDIALPMTDGCSEREDPPVDGFYDSNLETDTSYKVAQLLVQAINGEK